MKKIYPVIFTEKKGCYLIEVPDLEILTQGTDLENAIDMARDAISITIISMEDINKDIPQPSDIKDIDIAKGKFTSEGKSFVSVVDCDIDDYRRMIDTKPVRRNVSLPGWLNYKADTAGINVSRVLQDALIDVLKIDKKH